MLLETRGDYQFADDIHQIARVLSENEGKKQYTKIFEVFCFGDLMDLQKKGAHIDLVIPDRETDRTAVVYTAGSEL